MSDAEIRRLQGAAAIVRELAALDNGALATACWAIRKLHRCAAEWIAANPERKP